MIFERKQWGPALVGVELLYQEQQWWCFKQREEYAGRYGQDCDPKSSEAMSLGGLRDTETEMWREQKQERMQQNVKNRREKAIRA